jgi:hypothetical protein
MPVVYLPSERRETLGSDIGGLLGAFIGASIRDKAQKQQQQEAMQFVEGMRAAPDRAAAMEVISNHTAKFRTPQDYTQAFRLLDEFHPASMETPTPTTAYDPNTGAQTTVFPNRRQMVDKKYWQQQGVTLTKPEMDDFYAPVPSDTKDPNAPPVFQHLGRAPVDKRPEGGLTLKEIELGAKSRTEERQIAAGERADRRLADSEKRMSTAISGISARLGETEGVHAQNTMKAIRNNAALILNAKPLPDGSFDFGGDENKKKQFVDIMDYVSTRVESNPKVLKTPTAVERLTSEAIKATTPKTLKEPDKAAAPEPKPKGGVSALYDRIMGDKKLDAATPSMSAEERTASVSAAKAAADRVRNSGLSVQEKSEKLKEIRKRLTDAGIKEDI